MDTQNVHTSTRLRLRLRRHTHTHYRMEHFEVWQAFGRDGAPAEIALAFIYHRMYHHSKFTSHAIYWGFTSFSKQGAMLF